MLYFVPGKLVQSAQFAFWELCTLTQCVEEKSRPAQGVCAKGRQSRLSKTASVWYDTGGQTGKPGYGIQVSRLLVQRTATSNLDGPEKTGGFPPEFFQKGQSRERPMCYTLVETKTCPAVFRAAGGGDPMINKGKEDSLWHGKKQIP